MFGGDYLAVMQAETRQLTHQALQLMMLLVATRHQHPHYQFNSTPLHRTPLQQHSINPQQHTLAPTNLDAAALLEVKVQPDRPKHPQLAVVGHKVRTQAARVVVQQQTLLHVFCEKPFV